MPPYHFRCRTTTVAHFEPADTWQKASHWAIDGKVPKREIPRLLDYARNARWGTHLRPWERSAGGDGQKHPTAFVHFKKHGLREMEFRTLEEYNQALISLVRRADRDVYLAIHKKEQIGAGLATYRAEDVFAAIAGYFKIVYGIISQARHSISGYPACVKDLFVYRRARDSRA